MPISVLKGTLDPVPAPISISVLPSFARTSAVPVLVPQGFSAPVLAHTSISPSVFLTPVFPVPSLVLVPSPASLSVSLTGPVPVAAPKDPDLTPTSVSYSFST